MSLLNNGLKGMKDIKKGLAEAGDRSTFLWGFIDSQLDLQPDENLVDLRRLINRKLKVRRRLREGRKC